jgi:N utilization substance protein A
MWKNAINSLGKIDGVGDIMIDTLYKYGFRSARDVMMADLDILCEVPGIGRKLAEKMQRSAARVVAEEEEELRAGAEARKAEAAAGDLGLDGEKLRFMEIRGIGEKTIDQLAEGGYYTIMQVFEENNVVKLGEVTGIGIKKARQIKQAISQYLEEAARSAILPDVEPAEEAPAAEEGEQMMGEQEVPQTEEVAEAVPLAEESQAEVEAPAEEEVVEEEKDSGTEPTEEV